MRGRRDFERAERIGVGEQRIDGQATVASVSLVQSHRSTIALAAAGRERSVAVVVVQWLWQQQWLRQGGQRRGAGATFAPAPRSRWIADQPIVHALPLTLNAVGEALLLDQVPWKPNEVEPPAGTAPL